MEVEPSFSVQNLNFFWGITFTQDSAKIVIKSRNIRALYLGRAQSVDDALNF
jgi:hypothetical protein